MSLKTILKNQMGPCDTLRLLLVSYVIGLNSEVLLESNSVL